MAGALGIEVLGLDRVQARLAALPRLLDEAERRAVQRGALRMVSVWKRNATGPILKRRTGGYAQSIDTSPVQRTAGGHEARVGVRAGVASAYAKIHETGGVIRPKGHPLLSIPVGKTNAGVARESSPRDFPDGFWTTSKRGNVVFLRPLGGGRLELLFVGKEQVTIPARRPMARSFDTVRPLVRDEFEALVKKATGSV